MAYKYTIDAIAADEYEEAFNWYENKSPVAADNLIIAVQGAIAAACSDPYRYRNTHNNLRELTLKKYPYNLVYYIDDANKTIVVTSLYHHKRHPEGKYDKSKMKGK